MPGIRKVFEDLDLSPDGRWLATTVEGSVWNIWIYGLVRATLNRFTFEGDNRDPLWNPDGKHVAYTSFRDGQYGIYQKSLDGSSPEEKLTASQHFVFACSWTPDGKKLAVGEIHPETGWDVLILDSEQKTAPRPFLQTTSNELFPCFSPDGRRVAYNSNETGRPEVYVQAFPGPGGKWQISSEGGDKPIWSADGKELYYRNGEKTMAVSIETEPMFRPGTPYLLFEGNFFVAGRDYDITPDGQAFAFIQETEQVGAGRQINLVLNWFEELRKLLENSR